jgi:hypothetical protein
VEIVVVDVSMLVTLLYRASRNDEILPHSGTHASDEHQRYRIVDFDSYR